MSADDHGDLMLNDREMNSPLWLRISEHLRARLERMRIKNDSNLAPEETAMLRGRIAELKNLLAAGESQD